MPFIFSHKTGAFIASNFVPNPFRRVDLDRYRRAPSRGPPDARSSSSSSGLHMHQTTQSLERSSASASASASVAGASAASASSSSRSRHGTPSKSQGGGAAQSSMSGSGGGGLAQVNQFAKITPHKKTQTIFINFLIPVFMHFLLIHCLNICIFYTHNCSSLFLKHY